MVAVGGWDILEEWDSRDYQKDTTCRGIEALEDKVVEDKMAAG